MLNVVTGSELRSRSSALSCPTTLLLLVVGCPIVLRPCAFGMVAVNLARLIILHGSARVALVIYLIYLNVPSFCLLGMVGSLQIKFVTLMLCMVGWLVGSCARDALVPCPSMTCACLYHGPSYLPVHWSCPLAHPLGLPCLRGPPVWVWLGLFGSLPPWFPFLRCWLVFRWAVCTCGLGALASRRHGVVCSRWAFALGVHGVLLWWAAAALTTMRPSAEVCSATRP